MPAVLIDFSKEEYDKLKSKISTESYRQKNRFNIEEFIKKKSLE